MAAWPGAVRPESIPSGSAKISAEDAWRSTLPEETISGAEILQASSSDAFGMKLTFYGPLSDSY